LRDDKFACDIVAAHINHGLRGAESDRDEAFVRDLCSKLHIPFKTVGAGVAARPPQTKMPSKLGS